MTLVLIRNRLGEAYGRSSALGVLGTAAIARNAVVPALQVSAAARAVAVASRDTERAAGFARHFGIGRVFNSYEELLADPEVDIIYVPLPNALHAVWAIRAAEAGKSVLCEKPLAASAFEAERVVEACAKHKVLLMEGFMYRFHPQNRRVRELVKAGVIGEVREVRAHLSVRILTPEQTANVRFDPDLGGGSLLDMGCYTVDIARTIFDELPFSAVAAAEIDERLGVDVSLAGILVFTGGRLATLSCSFKAGGQGSYTLIGTKGTIEVPRAFVPGLGTRAGEGLVIVVDEDGYRREERFAPVDQYQLMVDAFSTSLRKGQPVPDDPRKSVDNLLILDALARAASEGRSQTIGTAAGARSANTSS